MRYRLLILRATAAPFECCHDPAPVPSRRRREMAGRARADGSGLYLATACIVAYRFSGHNGIDASQCLGVPKFRALEHDK